MTDIHLKRWHATDRIGGEVGEELPYRDPRWERDRCVRYPHVQEAHILLHFSKAAHEFLVELPPFIGFTSRLTPLVIVTEDNHHQLARFLVSQCHEAPPLFHFGRQFAGYQHVAGRGCTGRQACLHFLHPVTGCPPGRCLLILQPLLCR